MTRAASNAKTKPVPARAAQAADTTVALRKVFAGCFGALLGLALLKFGNPVIMEKYVDQPANFWEWLLNPWPVTIGYLLLGVLAVMGLLAAQWKPKVPKTLLALPLAWLFWELMAAGHTESGRLTQPTVIHFTTCVICFYLGLFSLGPVERLGPFWPGLLAGFFLVLVFGFQQHFGGLEEARKYWLLYVYPNLKEASPTLMKKMSSNRIFSTLFYPNTLAQVILLMMPVVLAVLWSLRERFTIEARRFLVGATALAALACLYWSGSKGGWLLMLAVGLVGAMFLPIQRRIKIILVAAVLVLGLAGFALKNAGYFQKGATSVEARFDYWRAAVKTAQAKPLFGNGPGTFGEAYRRIKKPESEMSLLAHNDYLQQASDSGVPGFLTFAALVVGTLVYGWRKGELTKDWVRLGVWLGLLGWALQSFLEFGLYIPAVAWPAFVLMGWMVGQCGNRMDSPQAGR